MLETWDMVDVVKRIQELWPRVKLTDAQLEMWHRTFSRLKATKGELIQAVERLYEDSTRFAPDLSQLKNQWLVMYGFARASNATTKADVTGSYRGMVPVETTGKVKGIRWVKEELTVKVGTRYVDRLNFAEEALGATFLSDAIQELLPESYRSEDGLLKLCRRLQTSPDWRKKVNQQIEDIVSLAKEKANE